MSEEQFDDKIAKCVYRLIKTYVEFKTDDKSGMKLRNFKRNEKGYLIYPPDYREAREKVCIDAFLAMRGRREQDFVEYFTGTICSVPQFLPESEYLGMTQTLMTDWD